MSRKLRITFELFKDTPNKVRYTEVSAVLITSEREIPLEGVEASGAFYIRQDVLNSLAGTNEHPKTLVLTVEVL